MWLHQAEDEKTTLTARLERLTAECERMKKDALHKSSTAENMMKKVEQENSELTKAVKMLKEKLRVASEDGKRAGRMVEGLKKQVEELRLEIRVRAKGCCCYVAALIRSWPPPAATRRVTSKHLDDRMCKKRHNAKSNAS